MTVTSTVPEPAGTVTVSFKPPALTRRPVAARAPKQTVRTLLRSWPLMTARVPGGPVRGDMPVNSVVPMPIGAGGGTTVVVALADVVAVGCGDPVLPHAKPPDSSPT